MKAMIFAAGLGTRLKPFTDSNPKALAVVNNQTLLQRNIQYLQSYGINDFVINVHHFSDKIKQYLEDNQNFEANIQISDESDEVLETGGGLVKAKDFFTEDFLVMNVDILTDLNIDDFIESHNKNQPLVSLAVSERESSRKLLFNENMQLKGWKNLVNGEEKKAPSSAYNPLAFSGVHIINPKLFSFMPTEGKFSIMNTYMDLMADETIKGYDHSGGKLIDVGKPKSIEEAEALFP